MKIQELITALLQGDLKNDAQLAELLEQLTTSSEIRQQFLEQIELNSQLNQFVGDIHPTSASIAGIWERIDAFEHGGTHAVAPAKSTFRPFWFAVVLALLLGVGFGYILRTTDSGVPSWNADIAGNGTVVSPDERVKIDDTVRIAQPANNASDVLGKEVNNGVDSVVATEKSVSKTVPLLSDLPSVSRVLTPNGGETYKAGSTIPILWAGESVSEQIMVEYSLDGGDSWLEVKGNASNRQRFLKLPSDNVASSECLVRIGIENRAILSPEYLYAFNGHDNGTGTTVAEISPDGTLLATTGIDTKVLLWDLQTGSVVHSLDGHTSSVTFGKFNQGGTMFASCSQDGSVQIWDVKTGEQEHLLLAQGGGQMVPWAVAFNPDNAEIAVSNDDGTITLWDSETGEQVQRFPDSVMPLKPHTEAIRYLEYSKDGLYLIASATDKTGSVLDMRTGQVLQRFEHFSEILDTTASREETRSYLQRKVVNGIQQTHDGEVIITSGYDGLVKFWNAESGVLLRSKNYHNGTWVSSIALSPDGALLASVGYDGSAKIVDSHTGDVLATFPMDDQKSPILRASFSPDMRFLALAHSNGKATLWSLHPYSVLDTSDAPWSIEPCSSE